MSQQHISGVSSEAQTYLTAFDDATRAAQALLDSTLAALDEALKAGRIDGEAFDLGYTRAGAAFEATRRALKDALDQRSAAARLLDRPQS